MKGKKGEGKRRSDGWMKREEWEQRWGGEC